MGLESIKRKRKRTGIVSEMKKVDMSVRRGIDWPGGGTGRERTNSKQVDEIEGADGNVFTREEKVRRC